MAPEATSTETAAPAAPNQIVGPIVPIAPSPEPVDHRTIDIESLVPEELRAAKAKVDAERAARDKTAPVKDATPVKAAKVDVNASDDEPDDEGDAGNLEADELDLSDEAVNKFLDDDDDTALVKKKGVAKKDDAPSWHSEPEYQEIAKKAARAGIEAKELDTLIQKVADTSKIESSTYTANLTKERDDLKGKLSDYDKEVTRLRKVEKAAHFDMNIETQDKFTRPMNNTIAKASDLLETEGVSIPVMKLLNAPNRVKFHEEIADIPFDEAARTKLSNLWSEYNELNKGYNTAKKDAQINLSKQLNIEITPKDSDNILRESLFDLIEQDEFSHIKEAIGDGLQKHPQINNIVASAKQDLRNLMLAISNPVDHVNSREFKNNLGQYVIDNADAKYQRAKVPILEKALEAKTALLEKALRKYATLKGSGKGIQGITGTARNGAPRSNADSDQVRDSKAARLEAFRKGEIDFDEL